MTIPIEDISALAACMHKMHGAAATHRINQYIEQCRADQDRIGIDLWLKVFAVRQQYAQTKKCAGKLQL